MEDHDIIRLYWARDPAAIAATADKYGPYCTKIAANILGSGEDAEECVNDAYLRTWNAIPPQWPERLAPFLGKIVRNCSLDRYRRDRAEKRAGQLPAVLDELAECVSGGKEPEAALDRAELAGAINSFLAGLPRQKRVLFLRRYWYAEPVAAIAADLGMTAGGASMALKRLREKLKKYLLERGFDR